MNERQHIWWFLIFKGLFLLAIGLFFIFSPELAVKGLAFYIGIILVAVGLISLWNTRRISKLTKVTNLAYMFPLTAVVSGIVLLFFAKYALTVFALAIGIWVLLDGIELLKGALPASKYNKDMGRWLILMGIISLIIGIVILINPVGLIIAMTVFFGVILALSGGFLIALGMKLRE